MPLLAVDGLTMRFGGLLAVDQLSFEADDRAITALIGPNGAGKTTVFNCMTGFYRPTAGALRLTGEHGAFRLDRLRDHQIARRAKVARTFQNIRVFPHMTVLENLIIAQHKALMRASLFTVGGLLGRSVATTGAGSRPTPTVVASSRSAAARRSRAVPTRLRAWVSSIRNRRTS